MLDFSELEVKYGANYMTEPRITWKFSNEELLAWKNGKNLELENYPNHSQDCERCVQNTYKAAEVKIGFKKRHQHILLVNENRKKFNSQTTKADFLKMILHSKRKDHQQNLQRHKYFCDQCDSSFSREILLHLHKSKNHTI